MKVRFVQILHWGRTAALDIIHCMQFELSNVMEIILFHTDLYWCNYSDMGIWYSCIMELLDFIMYDFNHLYTEWLALPILGDATVTSAKIKIMPCIGFDSWKITFYIARLWGGVIHVQWAYPNMIIFHLRYVSPFDTFKFTACELYNLDGVYLIWIGKRVPVNSFISRVHYTLIIVNPDEMENCGISKLVC